MKIDNPYHNPFCDHKTPRHTATHNTSSVTISSHLKEYFLCPQTIRRPPTTLFLTISHLATALSYLCDRNREDTHARDT